MPSAIVSTCMCTSAHVVLRAQCVSGCVGVCVCVLSVAGVIAFSACFSVCACVGECARVSAFPWIWAACVCEQVMYGSGGVSVQACVPRVYASVVT